MTESSKIEWTHHTFNPWWGCTKVSPGCDHCHAETFAKRVGEKVWGPGAPRRLFGDKHWSEPLRWNTAAEKAGERHRVFCASMADVFEGRPDDQPLRLRLWSLIRATPNLDWLLLTKRPGAIEPLLQRDLAHPSVSATEDVGAWLWSWLDGCPPANVWLGTTVEDQQRADERIPKLLATPATLRFLSVEPLLGPVDLTKAIGGTLWMGGQRGCSGSHHGNGDVDCPRERHHHHDERCERGIDWVIVGGESGSGARPCDIAWIRRVVDDCASAEVPVFVKQLGASPRLTASSSMAASGTTKSGAFFSMRIMQATYDGDVALKDRKGGNPDEWPADLRVRQFPKGGAL